ncbi:UDP-N-acetylmuramoyl-tripeptide--D-alanyl-D-alanine ligase [Flavobacteriales bacterium 34_180_T64]|nr:UDP-N-acetylmuramoyl-tripeptide--D-alanyl-D-alanine ligase [Flavobacteriales bacterium 34_180_T64]
MTIKDIYQLFLECKLVSTDTRAIETNSLFFALKGENFNGNTFASKALEEGAKYCVIDEKKYSIDNKTILVDNVLETLQNLATYHRTQLNIPIIALTGSNGKTTTKELINSVLSTSFTTSATLGNLNNHIGVPLTLLQMDANTEIGIVEMGANHPGEIAFLSTIALPHYGLITNFGKAHLEGFGSIEGVINAKSELYDHLKRHDKLIFVNSDDSIQVEQLDSYESTYSFGSSVEANTRVEFLGAQPNVSVRFNNISINSQLTGSYNFNNIAIAIAVGSYFNVSDLNIKKAIENYIPSNNRSQIINKGTNTIILDAYNANPTSMKAALNNLKDLDSSNKIAILGDMFELGTDSKKEHQFIADFANSINLQTVYLVGEHFAKTNSNGVRCSSFDALKEQLLKHPIKNHTILIKGSRGMALERTLNFIK